MGMLLRRHVVEKPEEVKDENVRENSGAVIAEKKEEEKTAPKRGRQRK